jgi:hypothetical protein
VAGRVSIVSFDHQGREWYCVTDGRSVFEAVRNSVKFFADPYWCGPKPDSQAVFKVALLGDGRTWRVRGDRVKPFSASLSPE